MQTRSMTRELIRKELWKINHEYEFLKTVDLLQNKPDYVLKIKTQLHEYENLMNINATKKEKIQKSFEIMVLAKLFIQFMLVNKDIHYSFIETIYNKLIEIRNHISNVDIASHQLDENFILYYFTV